MGDDGLVEPPLGMRRVAEIAVRFRETRVRRDCLALRARRLFIILQFIECDAESRRHLRLDLERTPRRFDNELRPTRQAQSGSRFFKKTLLY